MSNNIDLSSFSNVFCDSKNALLSAYDNGLSHDALIRTSSPALLFDNNTNIHHVESRWTINELREFQESIQVFCQDIYDAIPSDGKLSHAEKLVVAYTASQFQKILYKAACLSDNDLNNKILFIKVSTEGDSSYEKINTPWDKILSNNENLKPYIYKPPHNTDHSTSPSLIQRMKLSGLSGIVYRIMILYGRLFPQIFWKGRALVSSENELIIDTSFHLLINRIKPESVSYSCPKTDFNEFELYQDKLLPVIRKRLKRWVVPGVVEHMCDIFFHEVGLNRKIYREWLSVFDDAIHSTDKKSILLTNSPVNIKELALSEICNKRHIPVISAQHGVSREISKLHSEFHIQYETNIADLFLAYNHTAANKVVDTYYNKGSAYTVGISKNHFRIRKNILSSDHVKDILYLSSNIYKGNVAGFGTHITDYDRAINEDKILSKVLSKIPYAITYKAYPECTKRYIDKDPVLDKISQYKNVSLFSDNIDARYLFEDYRIIIVSGATSTISWALYSGKPVVFINHKHKIPLSDDAHSWFSKSLFLFDDWDSDFYSRLRGLLSLPPDKIYHLWRKKENIRNKMISKYISSYSGNSGQRASQVILDRYFRKKA